jgi:C_GCAxxG_C_C family probable redox protein
VLLAVAESEGIQSDLIPKIATGFCGGVSRTCGMCGAVSGGIMVIGLFAGRSAPTEPVAESYGMVRKLVNEFGSQFGSTNCKDLTGCDLGTEEGQNYFKENNIRQKCRFLTEEATRISLSLIEDKLRAGRASQSP